MLAIVPALFLSCSSPPTPDPEQSEGVHEKTAMPAGISVVTGPTAIPRGDAVGDRDITVSNEFFAVSFAVETASPWGVARGGILDIAIKDNGEPGLDFISLVDFMPNYWSAWPTTYQQIALEINTPELVVVRSLRDFGGVELDTRFEIRSDSKLIRLHTIATNRSLRPIPDLRSGYIAWPDGGQLFGMPGLTEGDATPVTEESALGKWSASYSENWALGLHAPYSELVAYTGRDRYLKHTLEIGATREFEAWLQIEDQADLARMVQAEITAGGLASGRVFGRITNHSGDTVDRSAAVIESQGRLYTWTLADQGGFDMRLPVGDYEIYATAADHAQGSSRNIEVLAGSSIEMNLSDLQAPGTVKFSVVDKQSHAPLDSMISITEGNTPVIQHFGKSRFFTELEKPGSIELSIAPGQYKFDISAAGGFSSNVMSLPVQVESGKKIDVDAQIEVLASPARQHWFGADLHHHSDVLDGFTEPGFVLRSQLAAGVDIAFLSDHDSIINNAEMKRLAGSRAIEFIGGTELSASWAHFNAYPIDSDKTVDPGVGLLPVTGIFAEARRLGADIISVNHPYGNYGYFDSLKKEAASGAKLGSVVPGGYVEQFDLIEITVEHVPETLQRAWSLWNAHQPVYFAAGSDVHDVWGVSPDIASGSARSYVHVPGELTVDSYIAALKAGHSYASQGPIIYPEIMFGTILHHPAGERLELNYNVQAVAGLRTVQLISQGLEQQSIKFDDRDKPVSGLEKIQFAAQPVTDSWYSLVVEDANGNYAYSNPLWIKIQEATK